MENDLRGWLLGKERTRVFRLLPVIGDTILFDPPEPNHLAIALAERAGMQVVFETACMYRNGCPQISL